MSKDDRYSRRSAAIRNTNRVTIMGEGHGGALNRALFTRDSN
jgi:hypothetical protein